MTRFKYLNKTRSDAINSLSIFFYAKKKKPTCAEVLIDFNTYLSVT